MAEKIEIPQAFTKKETADAYEFTGDWECNGGPRCIEFPPHYRGRIADLTVTVIEKLLEKGDTRFKKKTGSGSIQHKKAETP